MFLPITPITAPIVTNSDIQNPLPSTSSTLPSVLTSPPPSRASTPVSVTHKAEAAASTLAIINTAVRTFPEWPDGDIILEMTPHSLSGFKTTGWATTGLKSWSTHGTKCLKVKCIGVFTCTTEGCSFVKRPSPTKKKLVLQISSSTCTIHESTLAYSSCPCTITWREYTHENKQSLSHKGTHTHPRPPVIRLPPAALQELSRQVLEAPSKTPKSLLVGSSFNESVRSIHESNNNLDRLAYRRRKILKAHHVQSNLHNMIEWQVAYTTQYGWSLILHEIMYETRIIN